MCGACGERGDADWARPWVAGPVARAAVARAVSRVRPSSGVRVSPAAGGWLVARPTGGSAVCATLGELVAAVRAAAPGPVAPLDPARASGRLAVPEPDGRTGIVLRVDPGAPSRGLDASIPHARPSPRELARTPREPARTPLDYARTPREPARTPLEHARTAPCEAAEVVVSDEAAALAVLAELATPVWLRRLYLARIEGVSAPWGQPLDVPPLESGALAADAVVRLEWARQAGRFDDTAHALRCPLDDTALLDVEIRAGHVVRARTEPYETFAEEISGSGAC